MEKTGIKAAQADESHLQAVSYLHEAGRIFDEWWNRIRTDFPCRREVPQFFYLILLYL